MKQYMANLVMTDVAAQRPTGAPAASPARATVALAGMEPTAPTGPVQATGQKPRHGEGE
jgi:hypothetical protein